MSPTRTNPRAALLRLVLRPLLFGIPFALFFTFMQGDSIRTLPAYYLVTLLFSFTIVAMVELNRAFVVPRILPPDRAPGHPLEIASFALAAILGSVIAGTILNLTVAPGMFGSTRQVITFLIFSVIFTAFFMALVYAVRWKALLVERVEKTAREAQELRIAAEIQQALLPPRRRSGSSYEAAGASLPCRTIGGDFFEYFDFTSGRMGFALGDVAGKGPPAAILAAMVQGILATHADEGPAATLNRVNEALCRRAIEGRFATMAYVVLDPGGMLTSCSAGHNPAVLLRANGSMERPDRGGLVLGAFDTARYEEEAIALETGDTLVLFSDGVTDAENPVGDQYGEERLLEALAGSDRRSPDEILDRVLASVRAFAAEQPPADDVTVLVIRYGGAVPA
ncbi:MAG TPA: PP2C family protein-serine/threonine phosphatase [Candidatus Eisenbacteria bacterium]|nr:PP2C family protein-serine/threonine phosphatase [Candidatus Eisenbacteria bacterium]